MAQQPADIYACTRPPGENFSYALGCGPCDCPGCLRRSAAAHDGMAVHARELDD